MTDPDHSQDEASSLHESMITAVSESHRQQSIDEREPLQNRDQNKLRDTDTASPGNSSCLNGKPEVRRAISQKSTSINLRTFLTNSWLHEVFSLGASWACQIWLVVILVQMNNRPLNTWTLKISLNAMVAALSTISKALLLEPVGASIGQLKWLHLRRPRSMYDFELFDQASRGSLGSISLLVHRPLHVVSLGCFVTILSAALGPFTQQVISYANRQVDLRNSSATFGVAYNYNVTTITGSKESNFFPNTFDSSMRANILGALYNSKTPPVFNCTSACAWNGTYVTLGFGYECKDVTEAAAANRSCINSDPRSKPEPVDPYNGTISQACNMTTPGGVLLKPDHFPVFDGTWHTTTKYVSIASSSKFGVWNLRMPKPGKSYASLVTLAQYERDPDFLHGGRLKENVTECEVSAVAWRYSGVTVEGNELVISTREKIPLDEVGRLPTDSSNLNETGSVALGEQGKINFNKMGLQPMSISIWDWEALDFFLVNLLSDIPNVEGSQPYYTPDDKPPIFSKSASGGDITVWVARMTEAMTNALQAGPNSELMEGMSREVIIYVRVDWLWYALPLVVEVGAFILLVFAIWRSRSRNGVPLWKTSALASWAYRPEKEEDNVIRLMLEDGLPDLHTVEKEAKRWKIQVH
ncbi:hypothetical protein J7T55_002971 [Diaporthe amygdali]|uniref:uncharacterized protein n=1 Tax=Phomopsis amygdali TaxID=1214568 RepID=UPI0022FF2183|nr:uncharacterized protein J7T55_002971 [Diaporthe amygdali]KAJ0122458.1 hypothetical protein J7T55_002971 [Diaporthe amygdali]